MPRTTDFSAIVCSIARAADVVGPSWVPLILRDVYCGITRFEDLRADLGVARAVLSARLTQLVDDGLLEQVAYQESPPRHEYRLTPMGLDLIPVLMALMAWGDRWLDGGDGAPMALRHQACGQAMTPTVACDRCGEPLAADGVDPEPGPGGRTGPGTALIGSVVMGRHRDQQS